MNASAPSHSNVASAFLNRDFRSVLLRTALPPLRQRYYGSRDLLAHPSVAIVTYAGIRTRFCVTSITGTRSLISDNETTGESKNAPRKIQTRPTKKRALPSN